MIQLIGIHGATNERGAIQHAVRAPFQDLRRRDAPGLCEDFIPAVAADLAAPGGNCALRVTRLFNLSASDTGYAAVQGVLSPGRIVVTSIRRDGDRATADSVGPGSPPIVRHWRLAFVRGRWRIASPAMLQLHSGCRHLSGIPSCLQVLSMQLGQVQ